MELRSFSDSGNSRCTGQSLLVFEQDTGEYGVYPVKERVRSFLRLYVVERFGTVFFIEQAFSRFILTAILLLFYQNSFIEFR